jgi:uncharacterized protein (DUF2126 family)
LLYSNPIKKKFCKTMPDITLLTEKVATDKDAVAAATTTLDAAQTTLTADQAELDAAIFVNQIEALETNPALLATVEAALTADASKVSIVIAP